MFELTSINIESWLSSLSSDQLNDLAKSVDKYENTGLNDTIIKAYSSFVREMSKLQDTWQTINEQWISKVASNQRAYQKSLLVPSDTPTKSHFWHSISWGIVFRGSLPKITFGTIAHPYQKSLLAPPTAPPKVIFGI